MNRFLDLADLDRPAVEALIRLATRLEQSPEPRALEGRILALLFLDPSLRTLASFQAAMARLGGRSFVITPGQGTWRLETRTGVVMDGDRAEHVREAVPVLAGYADALGIRAFAGLESLAEDLEETTFRALAEVCPVPLINMESAMNHPCQALADWKTLDDLGVPAAGGRLVLSWAWHPRPLPLAVPAAVCHMAALRGMAVTVCRPPGFSLPEPLLERARRAARASGGSVAETEDRAEAMEGAHVLYAKSWTATAPYGDREADAALRAGLAHWCVDASWFAPARPDCRFLHCLPVRRNVVVRDEILDGPRSAVLLQARNRLFAQMAVLHECLRGGKDGTR